MELKLLTSDVDDLVDPDSDAIGRALLELIESSGDKPPRAVLMHDDGKDFIQFVAKTKGARLHNCHVQYCEQSKEEAGFKQYSSGGKTIEQVIGLFQGYANGDENWREGFNWQRLEPQGLLSRFYPVGIFVVLGLYYLVTAEPNSAVGIAHSVVGCMMVLGGIGYVSWRLRPWASSGPGHPWTEAAARSGSSSGGGCSGGSCGGSGGGGGGGDGGSCGGGGCGGGGE